MKLTARIEGNFRGITRGEVRAGQRAVTLAMSGAGGAVKQGWRDQIAAAGFQGNIGRLQKTVRHEVYPRGRQSLNAATTIWSRAPQIMFANETGATIRSAQGFWLAIPLPAAGKAARGKKITPAQWETKFGRSLQFIYSGGKKALLVDTGRKAAGNVMVRRGGKLSAPRTYKKRFVPMFVLLPQVKLRKRLSVLALGNQVAGTLPARVAALWKD